jgi:glycosyltransferase involved in cell wall biosynthesis
VAAVSFLIPAYNCADTLADAVDSILLQRLPEQTEIVILDDGSTDATADVAGAFAAANPRLVRTFANERNLGLGASRNRLVELARFDVLYWLDADNVLPSNMAHQVLAPIWDGYAYAAAPRRICYFPHAEHVTHEWLMANTGGWTTARDLLRSARVPAFDANYAYRKDLFDLVGPYRSDAALSDWTWGITAAMRGFEVRVMPGTFYLHRYRIGNANPTLWQRDEQAGANDRAVATTLLDHIDAFDARSRRRIERLQGKAGLVENYIERGRLKLATTPWPKLPTAPP